MSRCRTRLFLQQKIQYYNIRTYTSTAASRKGPTEKIQSHRLHSFTRNSSSSLPDQYEPNYDAKEEDLNASVEREARKVTKREKKQGSQPRTGTYRLFAKDGCKRKEFTFTNVKEERTNSEVDLKVSKRTSKIKTSTWPSRLTEFTTIKKPLVKTNFTSTHKYDAYSKSYKTNTTIPTRSSRSQFRKREDSSGNFVEILKSHEMEYKPYHQSDTDIKFIDNGYKLYWNEADILQLAEEERIKTPSGETVTKSTQESPSSSIEAASTVKVAPTTVRLVSALKSDLLDTPMLKRSKQMIDRRKKKVHEYLKKVKSERMNHPILSNDTVFKYVSDVIKTVNSQNALFFSIDCEFTTDGKIPKEIGISIFDSRKQHLSVFPHFKNIHVIVKEHYDEEKRSAQTFLGGSSIILTETETIHFLQTLIDAFFPEDINELNGSIPAAFVFQSYATDLKGLHNLGVKFPKKFMVMDTFYLYCATHGSKLETSTLAGMLNRFNIPHSYLHNAGNDAYYTMLLLLKLANPNFRIQNGIDNYMNELKYEHDWRYDLYQKDDKRKFLDTFKDRDIDQWNIYEFSVPKVRQNSKAALRTVYGTRYKYNRDDK